MIDMILWDVKLNTNHYITWAFTRNDAGRNAQYWLGGQPAEYTISPITSPGDRVHLGISIQL